MTYPLIDLLDRLNTYTYVVDPLVWVDPLGLAGCGTVMKTISTCVWQVS